MRASYKINQVTEMTTREFMPNHRQAMVTVNDDHRITANLNTDSGTFYLTDSIFIVDGSRIDNVNFRQFEDLARETIEDYIGQKI